MSLDRPTMAGKWLPRLASVPRLAARIVSWGLPSKSLVFGPLSLGDDLLCTAVLREGRRRGFAFTMFSKNPELFEGSSDAAAIHPIDDRYLSLLRQMGRAVFSPYYVSVDGAAPERDIAPERHVIGEMCRLCGMTGEVALRPYLNLSDEEIAAAPKLPRQIAIHSSGLAAAIPYPTKEWGAERFAALSKELSKEFSIVQIGSSRDPLLPGIKIDLRGKTTLRQAAAVQAASLAFVGLEGFLAHLARAVDCPSVIIHGGRSSPHVFDYISNINLHRTPPCSPCGLRNSCPNDLVCLSDITIEDVAAALNLLIERPRSGLPVESISLS